MRKITKRIIPALLALLSAVCCLTACGKGEFRASDYEEAVAAEMRGCFDFFYEQSQTDAESPAYGLAADRYPAYTNAPGSIASTGFALTALVIGADEGYITEEEGRERAEGTLTAFRALQQKSSSAYEGFFYHFLDMNTGARYGSCEISTVDTAIFLCGALHAGEYFGGETAVLAQEIYSAVNWNAFVLSRNGKKYVSMGYNNGAVLAGCWDWYAEHLMIYVLGAGSPTEEFRLDKTTYYDFNRPTGTYGGYEFIYSYFGSIFTYQFSHSWLDFRGIVDEKGADWYGNSVQASKAAQKYCADNKKSFAAYSETSWGLTACDTPDGYSGYLGAPPRGWTAEPFYSAVEGTMALAGAVGSAAFTPELSLKALKNYQSNDKLTGIYGLKDSYNPDRDWYASDYVGIDKGVSLLMLKNYKDEGVWDSFMEIDYISNGLEVLGFTEAP